MTKSHATSDQRQRLLEALRQRPISTIEARMELDVLHPAGRIQELREDHRIITHWTKEQGHRIARYVLLSGAQS